MRQASLSEQLADAWSAAITEDYRSQRINSERSLQAAYWAKLNQLLPIETHRVFIEPKFSVLIESKSKTVYPDLVICDGCEIAAVIELKYQPRKQPTYQKDLKTLRALLRDRDQLRLKHCRFRGEEPENSVFTFSRDAILAWAGVHTASCGESPKLFLNGADELAGYYLQLHAITQHGVDPEIVVLTG